MKILLINTVYSRGSTGKIMQSLHNFLLSHGIQSHALYGRGTTFLEDYVYKISYDWETLLHVVLTRLTGLQGVFSFFSTLNAIRRVKKISPDVVHIFNLHGYYLNEFKFLAYLNKNKIPIVYSMLDEYPYVGKCCYPYECIKFETGCSNCPQVKSYPESYFFDSSAIIFKHKKKAYSEISKITFTAPEWVVGRAKKSALLGNKKIEIIDEFIQVNSVFFPRDSNRLKNELGIDSNCKIFLNVCSYSDPRKGAAYYVKIAKLLSAEKFVFVHVGFDGGDIDLPDNYIKVPYVSSFDLLAVYYSMADAFVCTSLADTMPNVCLEALACGTPVCGFEGGGTVFTAEKPFGQFVSNGDVLALKSIIAEMPKKTSKSISECRDYAVNRYSVDIICRKFVDLYKNLMNKYE